MAAVELGNELVPWVTHDIRRTVRTRLSQLKVEERVAEKVLGHEKKGIAKVYDRWEFLDERRDALEAWARKLHTIVEPPPPGKVLDIRGEAEGAGMSELPPWSSDLKLKEWTIQQLDDEDDEAERVFIDRRSHRTLGDTKAPPDASTRATRTRGAYRSSPRT